MSRFYSEETKTGLKLRRLRRLRDVHVQIDDGQYEKFRQAVEKLGYRTMSAFLREQIRAIIQRAEEATK